MNTMNIVIAFVLLACAGLAQVPANNGWTRQTAPTTSHLRAVAVLDGNTAVAVGDAGTIVRTMDGGVTWKAQSSGTTNTIYAVAFVDANSGIAVTGGANNLGGTILRSLDGGVTWTQAAGTVRALWGVSFPEPNTAMVVGDQGTILRSIDGGSTWTNQSNLNYGGLRAVFFTDASVGTAVGGGTSIYRTTNGGTTWTAKFGLAGGSRFYGVYFTDPNTGIAVGDNGAIFRTVDGGATWQSQRSGTTRPLYGVSFGDSSNGIAVGESGLILRTTDGGTTWKEQSSGTAGALFGAFMSDAITGWSVGITGMIERTNTGGEPGPIAVSSASLTSPLAVNSLGSLFGSGLAAASVSADFAAAPTSLGGISLKIRDAAGAERLARLFYVSPGQINFEVPAGTAEGAGTVEVVNAPTSIAPVAAQIRTLSPGLFTYANSAVAYALRVEANGQLTVIPPRSAIVLDDRQVYLILYGTGIRNRSSVNNVRCTIGGIDVPVEYAGPSGDGVPGLDQVNLRLPIALKGNRDGHLVLTMDGATTNTVLVNVR